MSATAQESYVKWIQIGKDLGYEGVDLTAFVKERTDEDRDHRIAERELKKAENAERIQQQEIEASCKRQELEALQKQQEREALEKEKERQFELNKLKLIQSNN